MAGGRTSVLYHIGYDDGPHWGTELMHTALMFEDLKRVCVCSIEVYFVCVL